MKELSIFKNMKEEEINLFLKKIGARKLSFKKDELVFSNLHDNDLMGIILFGGVKVIKYDNDGNRTIINYYEKNSVFGKSFTYDDKDVFVISSSDSLILFVEYNQLINNATIYQNVMNILFCELAKMNERIEILSKKTIRDRLLSYFNMLIKKEKDNSFNLSMTYIELADYLSVDRSAMMREIKKMKNEKLISIREKKITVLK